MYCCGARFEPGLHFNVGCRLTSGVPRIDRLLMLRGVVPLAPLHTPKQNTSKLFAANLLRFVVHTTIAGHATLPKERTLGVEVFRKRAQYDTGNDPIVRVTAAELRKRGRQAVRASSELRLTLPLDHPLANAERLKAWLLELELVRGENAFSGHCGLGLNHFLDTARSSLYNPAQAALASLLLRHPGFNWEGGTVRAVFCPMIRRQTGSTFLPNVPIG